MSLVKAYNIVHCDECNGNSPEGAVYIAQGATGRFCVVMAWCKDCCTHEDIVPFSEWLDTTYANDTHPHKRVDASVLDEVTKDNDDFLRYSMDMRVHGVNVQPTNIPRRNHNV